MSTGVTGQQHRTCGGGADCPELRWVAAAFYRAGWADERETLELPSLPPPDPDDVPDLRARPRLIGGGA